MPPKRRRVKADAGPAEEPTNSQQLITCAPRSPQYSPTSPDYTRTATWPPSPQFVPTSPVYSATSPLPEPLLDFRPRNSPPASSDSEAWRHTEEAKRKSEQIHRKSGLNAFTASEDEILLPILEHALAARQRNLGPREDEPWPAEDVQGEQRSKMRASLFLYLRFALPPRAPYIRDRAVGQHGEQMLRDAFEVTGLRRRLRRFADFVFDELRGVRDDGEPVHGHDIVEHTNAVAEFVLYLFDGDGSINLEAVGMRLNYQIMLRCMAGDDLW